MSRRNQESLAVLEAATAIAPREPRILVDLAWAYARLNRRAEATAAYRRLQAEAAVAFIPFANLVMASIAAGDLDAAVDYSRKGVQQAERQMLKLLIVEEFPHERLAALRDRQDFEQVVRQAEIAFRMLPR
jgi:Flp pilus assembly protein TadD